MVFKRLTRSSRKSIPRFAKSNYRKAKPSRFPSGKKTYKLSRQVAKIINTIGETKIQALRSWNATPALPVEVLPTSGPCYFTNYCLGTAPASFLGPNGNLAFNNLEGFEWPQGTGANQRIGRYMYLKRTTLQLRIAMNPLARHGPVKFRVIVYKEKRNRYNTAGGGNPCDDLFLSHVGGPVGINTANAPNTRAMNFNTQLVNKRNYQVVKDMKFTLTTQNTSASGSTEPFTINQHFKSEKMINLSLGHYKKTAFDDNGNPEDTKYRYCVSIIGMPVSNSVAPHDQWQSYVRGTVSVSD